MKNNRYINNGHYYDTDLSDTYKMLYKKKYDFVKEEDTSIYSTSKTFSPSLPADVDIFTDLPNYVYKNEDAKEFLNILREALVNSDLDGVTLSKLCVSECTDSGIVLDWIYNYFRIFFSFDAKDGNFYGVISSNPEEGIYSNDFCLMKEKQYTSVAKRLVEYVVRMIHA